MNYNFLLLACSAQTFLCLKVQHQTSVSTDKPKVVYASFTSSVQKYLDVLEAQVATWGAKPLAEGRYFCVGDRDFVRSPPEDFLAVDCGADMPDLPCKMGYIFVEANHRNADWLVVTQSDMYINTSVYEDLLASYDHTAPIALGPSFGCGCGGYRAGCDEVISGGGFCGGGVYALSGEAVRQIIADDEDGIVEKMKTYVAGFIPEDMANSCAMWQAGVRMYRFIEAASKFLGVFEGNMSQLRDEIDRREGIYSMHPVNPMMLKWFQASEDADDTERLRIELEMDCTNCQKEAWDQGTQSMMQMKTTRVLDDTAPEGTELHTCLPA